LRHLAVGLNTSGSYTGVNFKTLAYWDTASQLSPWLKLELAAFIQICGELGASCCARW